MKKTLSMLLAIVMVITIVPISAFAADTNEQFTIAFETDFTNEMTVGDVFTVTGMLSNNTEAFGAMALALKWNESVVKFTGFKMNGRVMDSEVFNSAKGYTAPILNQDDGIITATDTVGYDLNGKLFVANFEIIAESGELGIGLKTDNRSDYMIRNVEGTEDVAAILDYSAIEGLAVGNNDNGDEGEGTTSAYTAALNSNTTEVSVGQTVIVNVAVDSTTDTAFNAAEIKLSYPADKLTPVAPSYEHKIADGTLTFEDFGDDKNFGTSAYTVRFNAIADGIAKVTLTNAAFVNKANANKSDLIPADIAAEDATVEIEISKKTFDVTLPKDTDDNVIVEGETTVTDGENYTFTLPDTDKYEYDVKNMKVTVNGEEVEVNEVDGEYVIENVTGPVVIEGITRKYRSYNVTFAGNAADEVTDGALTATYNTPYTFTKPSAENFNYTVSITIGGTAYTAFSEENNVITIPGDVILGDIKITVEKVQTKFTVTVEKDEGIEATWNPTVVDEGNDVVLTITRVTGYTYKVTATMGGNDVEVKDNQDGTYTVENVTGNIVFKIEALLNVGGIVVQRYLTLDGSVMWLVTNENTMDEDKVPAYNGEAMFWSEKYNAYCYLVVADTLALGSLEDEITTDALDMISIIDGTATEVDYGMDVNKSGKVDAADAQFTYNMYNSPYYTGFDADNTVEKFLRADVNGDKNVNVSDADAIITRILS